MTAIFCLTPPAEFSERPLAVSPTLEAYGGASAEMRPEDPPACRLAGPHSNENTQRCLRSHVCCEIVSPDTTPQTS